MHVAAALPILLLLFRLAGAARPPDPGALPALLTQHEPLFPVAGHAPSARRTHISVVPAEGATVLGVHGFTGLATMHPLDTDPPVSRTMS